MCVVVPGVLGLYEAQWSFNAGFLLAQTDITKGAKWNFENRDSTDLGLCLCVSERERLEDCVCVCVAGIASFSYREFSGMQIHPVLGVFYLKDASTVSRKTAAGTCEVLCHSISSCVCSF